LATRVHFDVVIAGGGTAGCVLAGRLSEEPGRSVCLVEAGPDYGPYAGGEWPKDILDGRFLALDSHCWERDGEEIERSCGHAFSAAVPRTTPA
jgi:choline dehydrogenase